MSDRITLQVTRYRPDKNTQPVPVDYEVPLRKGTTDWMETPPLQGIRLEHDGYLEEWRALKAYKPRAW